MAGAIAVSGMWPGSGIPGTLNPSLLSSGSGDHQIACISDVDIPVCRLLCTQARCIAIPRKADPGTLRSRVVLGVWTEAKLSALKSKNFQVDRETAEDLLGLFHSPRELMVHSQWDNRSAILSGKVAKENLGPV